MRVLSMSSILGSTTELLNTLLEKDFMASGTGSTLNLGTLLEEVSEVLFTQVTPIC